jgi:alpha-1,3-rhamnosyltransferase
MKTNTIETKFEIEDNENHINPLVSIIVITYNSAKFVIETLESAKDQTYRNIELIISDDCSSDDTIIVCETWLKENKDRFVNTKIITVKENTGISKNCNRGFYAAEGEWIKLIAGDDALYEDAIEELLTFALLNDAKVVHSDCDSFMRCFEPKFKINNVRTYNYYMTSNLANAKEQYSFLSWNNKIVAPTVLINKELICEVGFFDERISMIEDLPMWLKITSKGYKFFYLEKKTAKYRIHENSVTERLNRTRVISKSEYQYIEIFKYYMLPNVNFFMSIFLRYEMIRRYVIFNSVFNKYNLFNDYFDRLTSLPFRKMVQIYKRNFIQ